jgi:hypothetical protein
MELFLEEVYKTFGGARHVIIDINVTVRIILRYSTAQVIVLVAVAIKLMLRDSIAEMNVLVASHSPQQAQDSPTVWLSLKQSV